MKAFAAPLMCLALVPAARAADTDIVSAEDPQAVLDVAKGFGSATLETDAQGDPKIVGRIDGSRYFVFFYGCEAGARCRDLQFYAGWSGATPDAAFIADWNFTKRYATAFLDKDGDANVKMDVNVRYGVTRRNLERSLDLWSTVLQEFRKALVPK